MSINQQFKTELLASTYFNKYIIKNKSVVMVVIGGSRSGQVVDESSDFDLRVVTLDDEDEVPNESFKWNGIRIHWYYRSIKKLLDLTDKSVVDIFGMALMSNIGPDNIIYINPVYRNLSNLIIERKDDISRYYFYAHYNLLKNYVDLISSSIFLKPEFYDKRIYQLCTASYFLLSQLPDVPFLTAIKRIMKKSTTKEQRDLALERIRLLKQFVTSSPLSPTLKTDIEAQIDELL
jgi:hypothetical protein